MPLQGIRAGLDILNIFDQEKKKQEERKAEKIREVERSAQQFSSLARDVAVGQEELKKPFEERKWENLPPEAREYVQNRRFITVRQGELGRKPGEPERMEIQDLRGPRTSQSLLTPQDIMGDKGDALTAQSQMSLDLGRKMRQRMADEAKQKLVARYGEQGFNQIRSDNVKRAQDKIAELDRKWAEKRKLRGQNPMREEVEFYKQRLNEGIGKRLKQGFDFVKNIPGVKPVVRTAGVAAGVAGGVYAYNEFIKPDSPQINVPNESGATKTVSASDLEIPNRNRQQPKQTRPRRSGGGYSNTIVPVRKETSADFAAYGADARSPGGAVGAQRRREAERVWQKWQEEDKAPKQEESPIKANLQRELRKISTDLGAKTTAETMASSNFATQTTPKAEVTKPKPVIVANQPLDLSAGEKFALQAGQETIKRGEDAKAFQTQMQSDANRRTRFGKSFQAQMQKDAAWRKNFARNFGKQMRQGK